jgi:hypothetical protein
MERTPMSAFRALDAARAARIEVRLDGNDLILSGAGEPPAGILKMLRQHKRSIVALLERPVEGPVQPPQPWDQTDWRAFYDEQIAIAEHDGLRRAEADARAFRSCVAEWLWRTAVVSPPGPCPICGDADQPNDPLMAIVAAASSYATSTRVIEVHNGHGKGGNDAER